MAVEVDTEHVIGLALVEAEARPERGQGGDGRIGTVGQVDQQSDPHAMAHGEEVDDDPEAGFLDAEVVDHRQVGRQLEAGLLGCGGEADE